MKCYSFISPFILTLNFFIINFLFNFSISLNLKLNEESLLKDKPVPFTMNVTYQNPIEDYTERKKFADEEINFKRRINELEQKLVADSDLLKMILNINNVQIQKLSEVVNVNLATLYYKALRFRPNRIEMKKPEPIPKVNILSMQSVESFIEKMVQMGKLNKEALEARPSIYFGLKNSHWEMKSYLKKLEVDMKNYKLMEWLQRQDTSSHKGDFVSAFKAFGVKYK